MFRTRSLYKARPSLGELYEEDSTIFAGFAGKLPSSVTLETLTELILAEFEELDTVCRTAAQFKTLLTAWASSLTGEWAKIAAVLVASYDPFSNYDRTDVESETIEGEGSGTSSSTGSETVEDVVTRDRQGQNSVDYVPVNRESTDRDQTSTATGSTETASSSSRERTLRSSGNIGVVTSQAMAEAEISLRERFSIYAIIIGMFRERFIVEVW